MDGAGQCPGRLSYGPFGSAGHDRPEKRRHREHRLSCRLEIFNQFCPYFFDAFSAGGVVLPTDQGDRLKPEDISDAIHFALTRPRCVVLNEVTIRPYWQER